MPTRRLAKSTSPVLKPFRGLLARLKKNERLASIASGQYMLYEPDDEEKRAALLRAIFDRLKSEARFDPQTSLQSSWARIEADALKRFARGP